MARPGVEIETIEILEHPRRVLRERVIMIPLIAIGNRRWYHTPGIEEILSALDVEGREELKRGNQPG